MAYLSVMKMGIKKIGSIGTIGMAAVCSADESPLYPRWLLCFCPYIWLMLFRGTGALKNLPALHGAMLAGGIFNLAFLGPFCASTIYAIVFKCSLAGKTTKMA
jgi:hypothetical protein